MLDIAANSVWPRFENYFQTFWGVYIMFPFQTRVSIVVLALTYVTTMRLDDVTRFGNCVQLLIGNELLVN